MVCLFHFSPIKKKILYNSDYKDVVSSFNKVIQEAMPLKSRPNEI